MYLFLSNHSSKQLHIYMPLESESEFVLIAM